MTTTHSGPPGRAPAAARKSKKSAKTQHDEPIGHHVFDGVALDLGEIPDNKEFAERSAHEIVAVRFASVLIRLNDKELERAIRDTDDFQVYVDLCDNFIVWKKRYEAGVELMTAATARLLIIFGRIVNEGQGSDTPSEKGEHRP
jgi:hypothetical protein